MQPHLIPSRWVLVPPEYFLLRIQDESVREPGQWNAACRRSHLDLEMSYPCRSVECVHTHTLESCIPFHSTSCCVALYNDERKCRNSESRHLHGCLIALSFHLVCAVIPEEEIEKEFLGGLYTQMQHSSEAEAFGTCTT